LTGDLARVEMSPLETGRPPRPYPGLRPFKPEEWRIFCGRETVTREVIGRLGESNVVLIHGGSGCGKSSLVAAGVLPSLQRDMELGGGTMASETIRPSYGPLTALAATLAKLLGPVPWASGQKSPPDDRQVPRSDTTDWTEALLFDPDIIERIETAIEERGLDLLCLVLDQFEEIFAWARDRRAADVEVMCRLMAALSQPKKGRRFVIIATMRSDFLGQCAQFPALRGVINTCQYFLAGLDDTMLERAIRDPAKLFGGDVDDALVTRLRTEAASTLDALPVLQHALMRMAAPKFALGPGWRLTLEDYGRVTTPAEGTWVPPGFVNNALSVHAEEIRAGLVTKNATAAKAVEEVFRALFDSAGAHLVRRPTAIGKLVAMAGDAGSLVGEVIEEYRSDGNDMLVRIVDMTTGIERIDVTHEALLRNWWRMKFAERGDGPGWIKAEENDALAWQTLAMLAADDAGPRRGGRFGRFFAPARTRLDSSQLARLAGPIARFRSAPALVTRFLLHPTRCDKVTDEPEWRNVKDLIWRSRRHIRIRGMIVAGVTFAIAGMLLAFIWIRQNDAAKAEVRRQQDLQYGEDQRAGLVARFQSAGELLRREQGDGSRKLTNGETALIQLTDQLDPQGTQGAGGWIWIGAGGQTNLLARPGGSRLDFAAVNQAGGTYYLAQNAALRASTPDANNSSKRLTALMAGTPVVAQGVPQKTANGQYWLKVTPAEQGTVYIQYADGNPARLIDQLRHAGFQVPAAQQLAVAAGKAEVRYCHKADASLARRAANAAIIPQRGAPLPTVTIGGNGACLKVSAPGTVELWIGTAD